MIVRGLKLYRRFYFRHRLRLSEDLAKFNPLRVVLGLLARNPNIFIGVILRT